ncbi:caffeoyl-CoA O-methyltransferase [Heyndrickxia sporothermodurans]|nr:caffeoyl-CoA O-methyltransferase [Heyndrickxia sporothermodurans]
MEKQLVTLLQQLEEFGTQNDLEKEQKEERMRNITRDTGKLLAFFIKLTKARNIIEIGTSNGYSTLWLAAAAEQNGGRVKTLEVSEYKAQLAKDNFSKSGLSDRILLYEMDAGHFLEKEKTESIDFIFLDSERYHYVSWWKDILRILKPGGLIVIDNVISHASEFELFKNLVNNTKDIEVVTIPQDSGLMLITK